MRARRPPVSGWRQEPKIREWEKALADAGCRVRRLRAERLIRRRDGELLFGMLRADVADPDSRALPPIALVRGNAVVVVPLLRNRDTGRERFLTVSQRRIGNGKMNVEFPAGMLDREVDDPAAVAVRELHEEAGLWVTPAQLTLLHSRPLHTSVGLLDEAIWFYGCVVDLPGRQYRAFEGARHGARSERERIVTGLRTAEEIEREALSLPVVMGLRLFQEWRRGKGRQKQRGR